MTTWAGIKQFVKDLDARSPKAKWIVLAILILLVVTRCAFAEAVLGTQTPVGKIKICRSNLCLKDSTGKELLFDCTTIAACDAKLDEQILKYGLSVSTGTSWWDWRRQRSATYRTATVNQPPVISGSPATTIEAGKPYSFTPTASDPEGKPLTFTITNKPAWATFTTSSGRLAGTPTEAHIGTTSGIVIAASDGSMSRSLPSFAIQVTAPPPPPPPTITYTECGAENGTCAGSGFKRVCYTSVVGNCGDTNALNDDKRDYTLPIGCNNSNFTDRVVGTAKRCFVSSEPVSPPSTEPGTARLSWTPPTENTDGSVLTNLSGTRIYIGTSATALSRTEQVPNPLTTTYIVGNLTRGQTYYFAVRAYTASTESANSNLVQKVIE